MRCCFVVLSLFVCLGSCFSTARHMSDKKTQDVSKFTIQMIGYSPSQSDDYVAVSREAVPGYIVAFEPLAHADRVHHMLLYGCTVPAKEDGFWRGHETCGYGGGSYILYAWARNAPNLVLPENVGFSVGHGEDGIKYFVLQVHYAAPFAGEVHDFSGVTLHISQSPPANLAAVLLFVGGEPIPPKRDQFQSNISCTFDSPTPIHPFAFRTHTHGMGRVVSAFYKHDEHWTKIGKRNPQWPQLFESISDKLTIERGDLMAASCRFDSHDKDVVVHMGAMGVDEMCNFYMMYYYDASSPNPYPRGGACGGQIMDGMSGYPSDGFSLLPSRPELEHHAHQSKVPFGVVQEAAYTQIGDVKLGQVAGIAFDNQGQLVVFHRAGRHWDAGTFDQYNVLLDKMPINDNVILVVSVEGNTTRIVNRLGAGLFYLPHGVYVDKEGYFYTTDVGSHTAAKWKVDGNKLVKIWEHGEKLIPDSDAAHLCKPTGLTRVDDKVFVTDGYCNSRVVVLDANTGKRKEQFGLPGQGEVQFELPHDVVATNKGNLLVTDRENGRVQELTTHGQFVEQFKSSLFSNVYSSDVHEDYVFMAPGRPTEGHENEGIAIFVGRLGTGLIEYAFSPSQRGPRETAGTQFGQPHSIRVSPDGDRVFVGDIGRATLWQFRIQHEQSVHPSVGNSWTSSVVAPHRKFGFLLVVLAVVVAAIGFVTVKRKWKDMNNGKIGFDKTGFKPLRTEETVGFISDGSDSE